MSELNRQSEESFVDYARRLLDGKNNKLYDINSTEMWELLFGEKLSKDEARKRTYGLEAVLNKMSDEVVDIIDEIENLEEVDVNSDILARLEQERKELLKAKIQYQDQKRENAKILRAEARLDNVKEYIQRMATEVSDKKFVNIKSPVRPTDSPNEGVLLISDWHYALEVKNFMNTYNIMEFTKRLEFLINKVIEYGIDNDIQKLHVVDLGDLVSGIIHNSIRVTSSEDVVTQTMRVCEILAEVLEVLAQNFAEVEYYSTLDNHSRVTPNKDDSLAVESFARFIPWYIEARLTHVENIHVNMRNVDEDIIMLDVCGSTCVGTHGHRDKLHDVVKNLSLMLKVFPEYIFMAHNHFLAESEDHMIEIIQNSSLSGCDDFAKHIRKSSKPAQKFMIFNAEGRKCTYNIVVGGQR